MRMYGLDADSLSSHPSSLSDETVGVTSQWEGAGLYNKKKKRPQPQVKVSNSS